MLGLLRLMSGRRLLIVAVLAVLLLSGSAALRSRGARLLACGVSLQMSPPSQCLHEVTRGVAAATAWLRSHLDASQDRRAGVPLTQKP